MSRVFHHHHGQRGEDVQRSNANDQADDDEGDDLLQFERTKEGTVLFHPIGGQESWSGSLLDGTADLVSAIEIVHFERDDRDHVGLSEQALRIRKAGEGHARVVLIEAGVKDADHAKSLPFRNDAERGQLPLRAGNQDRGTHLGIDRIRQVAADHDGWRGLILVTLRRLFERSGAGLERSGAA